MDRYRVKPNEKIKLEKLDPADRSAYEGDKEKAQEDLAKLNDKLEEYQELLYAEHKHRVLIVLQAMDTGGKDGVIRRVFDGVNPQGVRVASFKVPTAEELDHDYLWRVHKMTPGRGEIVIFNRSHYEDVLVVRVHGLVSEKTWKKRYDHINEFERLMANEGTTILKFFLHIDKDEQKERLQARLDEPDKHWKFSLGDLEERKLWNQYMAAYEDVLNKTSTPWAPWYVIPANRKWYRDLVISTILVNTLKKLDMHYPEPKDDLTNVVIE
ncbi:MAG TPA: polyphosphate kinase 2 family protein [Anaerolineaceae bacterium]|jgi:PPK2 family polyphosphate:nucleotide phosphotransferase|nr:polyphosphate kinase 2 family protein [Anaerolineaceae bacterium]HQF46232.1 polyphosphate kinase 2 family protein [Anaerolineaceae bacterium]HQH36300.1 polyphosphate kinase 2 family protein [Anaerolineaceae bacterium]HQL39261.1 polyphosphate kinase 2 family protein [Anaerolineaceae bacterium]